VVVPVGAVAAFRGPELADALLACPPAAAAGAIAVHAATLLCRCEAWRLAVGAIADRRTERLSAHAAGGAGFAAGAFQAVSSGPVRAVALRRLAGADAPAVKQLLVAEIPVFLLEAVLAAGLLAVAVSSAPVAPTWAAPLLAGGAIGALIGLRIAADRIRERPSAAGLRVLADRRRRVGLAALIVAVTALGLIRAWLVLAAFGLPHGVSAVAVTFVALGIFGLLPIGPTSTPGALLAVFGTVDPAAATAAGIAISATSFAAVGMYAATASGAVALVRTAAGRAPRLAPPLPAPAEEAET
jgi:hypothetical protein